MNGNSSVEMWRVHYETWNQRLYKVGPSLLYSRLSTVSEGGTGVMPQVPMHQQFQPPFPMHQLNVAIPQQALFRGNGGIAIPKSSMNSDQSNRSQSFGGSDFMIMTQVGDHNGAMPYSGDPSQFSTSNVMSFSPSNTSNSQNMNASQFQC